MVNYLGSFKLRIFNQLVHRSEDEMDKTSYNIRRKRHDLLHQEATNAKQII